jgi:hypothetical protein
LHLNILSTAPVGAHLTFATEKIMNNSAIIGILIATAISACSESRAEEALPLSNRGELSPRKIFDTCSEVFEMGEHHQSRGRIISALDSFAWVFVNLPFAPITKDLHTRNSQAFVAALAAADRQDIRVFGDQRAIRYLGRIVSDDILTEDLRKRAVNVRNGISSAAKDPSVEEVTTKKKGEQAAPSNGG